MPNRQAVCWLESLSVLASFGVSIMGCRSSLVRSVGLTSVRLRSFLPMILHLRVEWPNECTARLGGPAEDAE